MLKPKVSIAIPYHQTPRTAFFLSRLLNSVAQQTFTDYEIILTNQGSMPVNTNAAMSLAQGEIIKILYMDDYFAHPKALENIVKAFKKDIMWLATGCLHQRTDLVNYEDPHSAHFPEYSEDIETGNNTIGSPSVVSLRNEGKLLFDESLSYLLDCDLYKRYYQTYGDPVLLNDLNVVMGIHDGQVSNIMSEEEKLQEFKYMKEKYV